MYKLLKYNLRNQALGVTHKALVKMDLKLELKLKVELGPVNRPF